MITSLLLMMLAASPAPVQKISVYLTAPVVGGYVETNTGVQDSIKDVRKRLAKDKQITLVNDRARADLVLTITGRGIHSERTGQSVVTTTYQETESSSRTEISTQDTSVSNMWVHSVMESNGYRKEILGAYNNETGGWGECANQIANDVKSWIAVNAARIVQQRRATTP